MPSGETCTQQRHDSLPISRGHPTLSTSSCRHAPFHRVNVNLLLLLLQLQLQLQLQLHELARWLTLAMVPAYLGN